MTFSAHNNTCDSIHCAALPMASRPLLATRNVQLLLAACRTLLSQSANLVSTRQYVAIQQKLLRHACAINRLHKIPRTDISVSVVRIRERSRSETPCGYCSKNILTDRVAPLCFVFNFTAGAGGPSGLARQLTGRVLCDPRRQLEGARTYILRVATRIEHGMVCHYS